MAAAALAVLAAVAVPLGVATPAAAGGSHSVAVDVVEPTETEHFVWSVYWDIFNREPDEAGYWYWVDAIDAGVPRPFIADALTASYEFRAHMVADNFDWYLGRGTDPGGLAYWVSRMNAGLTIEALEGMITASPEYYNLCGATPEGWVDCLYSDVLLRDPDPGGAAYWVSLVNLGYDKAQITAGILMSPESLEGRVDGIYQWLLLRPSDPAGRVFWAQMIAGGYRDEQIIGMIIASTEYWNLAQTL